MDIESIIDRYYGENTPLRRILLLHSEKVAEKALRIIEEKNLPLDRQFVHDAAMLHDIGIVFCDAKGIECHGDAPYICHGLCGGRLLRDIAAELNMSADEIEPYARVCERHTGTGITREDIASRHLPLPLVDLLPETIEEQIICYADKFYSKSHPERTKTIEQARNSILKFSDEGLKRFDNWVEMFE